MDKACQDGGRRLRAPAAQPRIAIRGIADEREVIGNRFRLHSEGRDHAGLVADDVRAPVQLHDARALDRLREIFVGRADDHAVHPRIPGRRRGRGGQRVVRLELHHRPDDNPHRGERLFEERELRQEIRIDARARLVARPQRVAERFDDVVGRHADVRGAAAIDHAEHRGEDAAHRAHFRAVSLLRRRHRVVVPEELVGAVDQVHVQV